jgi:aryl-alcohol dehydrogenase-like predicted oxidoreductase
VSSDQLVSLGTTNLRVAPLGVGTWQWGDRMMWSYTKTHTEADAREAFQASLESQINFFDTAEAYGTGLSERLLGAFIRESGKECIVATKFMPLPWRVWKGALRVALRASLTRLGLERVHLYQMHWPFPPVPIEAWMDAMADAARDGLIGCVGVSNYSADQMRRAHAALALRGVPLASNQVSYSLLDRKIEKNGLMALCRELGVSVIAYSPIAKGVLTGKYTPENPPAGLRSRTYTRGYLERVRPLLTLLRNLGEKYGGKTPSQVALNWVICKGAIAIPGAKNARQAQENAEAIGWRLLDEDVAALDRVSDEVAP